ncbi:hypothetical protein [Thermophilibacter sp.]
MTGIEMLRELALDIDDTVKVEWFVKGYDERSRWKGHALAHELAWIADKIESEQRERYDELNDENERLRDMLNGVSYHLGMGEDVHYYSDDNYDECQQSVLLAIDERLMPEGYEWPRYEDDKPVMLGDTVTKYVGGGEIKVRSVEFLENMTYLHERFKTDQIAIVRPGERVKRQQVLAADGEPLEAGQTVWDTNGDELQVLSIEDDHERHVTCHYEGIDGIKANGWWLPHTLTHQRPVLDADGVPIEVGDDLYSVEGALSFHVGVIDRHACRIATNEMYAIDKWADPLMFTHTKPEPPDSWDRIEKDAQLNPDDYWMHHSGSGEERENAALAMSRDIMHRCIALAGVSE